MSATPVPSNVLPEPLRSFIVEGAAALDCDPRYIALPLLATVAGAIGNTRVIRLKRTWREPAVLWCAPVGESGTLKTPAMKLVMEPVYRRQKRLLKQYTQELAEYASSMKAWKATKKEDRGDEPEPPSPCAHVFCSDVTVEGLADRLADNSRGLLVAVDELSGWFARFDRYANGGGDVQHYLTMHSAGLLKVDRKSTDRKTIYVSYAAVSVVGGVQPAILRRILNQEFFDCGLAARMLLAMPDPRPAKWTQREISDATLNAVEKLYDNLFALVGEKDADGDLRPTDVALADDAQERFIRFVDDHAEQAAELEGADAAAWSKLKGYAARFALIFHLVRQAAGEDVEHFRADLESVEAGIALAEWFWSETQRIYHRFHESDEDRDRRLLLDLIHRLGGRVTPRDLKEHCRRFGTSEDAEAALNELVENADGSWEVVHTGGRGRPATMFALADSPDRPAERSVPVNANSIGNSDFAELERRNVAEKHGN